MRASEGEIRSKAYHRGYYHRYYHRYWYHGTPGTAYL